MLVSYLVFDKMSHMVYPVLILIDFALRHSHSFSLQIFCYNYRIRLRTNRILCVKYNVLRTM